MGEEKKLYPPTDVSVPLQCHPQQLSVELENHSIFRSEISTMENNVSYFRVLHSQQWQPPASAPDLNTRVFEIK